MCCGGYVRVHLPQNMKHSPRIHKIIVILVASETSPAVLYKFVFQLYTTTTTYKTVYRV